MIGKLTWRLVPFLFLLYIVAYLDRINVGFAALQMQNELHFNDAVYGFGAGLFFAGYFCFQVPSNVVLQRVGARRWIALLMLVWGAVSSAMILVRTEHGFYGLRFLLGAAEAGFFPGVILYLKNWFPEFARARTVARFMTAAPLAGVIGGPVSGALLNLHQRWGLSGWQWLFLMEGLPAILLGIVVWIYLPDHPQDAHWINYEERLWLAEALRQKTPSEARASAFAALGDMRMWILALVYFGLTTVMYGIALWLPTIIHGISGLGNLGIGLLTAVPYVASAVAMVLAGLHSDKSKERRLHTAVPAFLGAIALAVVAYSQSVILIRRGNQCGPSQRLFDHGAVLGDADQDPERHGGRRRHCADQFGREPWWVCGSLGDWHHPKSHGHVSRRLASRGPRHGVQRTCGASDKRQTRSGPSVFAGRLTVPAL